MAINDVRNIKLSAADVTFDGIPLGFTKGGVDVTLETATKAINVDQYGDTDLDERIIKRSIKVKVPLAEHSLEILSKLIPGATLVATGGAKASKVLTFSVNPTAAQTITINSVVFTYVSGAPANNAQIQIGGDLATTLANTTAVINAYTGDSRVAVLTASNNATTLTLTADTYGLAGNNNTVATNTTATGAGTFTGGADASKYRLDVKNAAGTSLSSYAKELRLHPHDLSASDVSEDIIVHKAMTPGAFAYSYKSGDERIYSVEFSGFVNTSTDMLFSFGDPSAA